MLSIWNGFVAYRLIILHVVGVCSAVSVLKLRQEVFFLCPYVHEERIIKRLLTQNLFLKCFRRNGNFITSKTYGTHLNTLTFHEHGKLVKHEAWSMKHNSFITGTHYSFNASHNITPKFAIKSRLSHALHTVYCPCLIRLLSACFFFNFCKLPLGLDSTRTQIVKYWQHNTCYTRT